MNRRSKEKKLRGEGAAAQLEHSPKSDRSECGDLRDSTPAASGHARWMVFGVCVFLTAITWMVFGQTLGHEFVNYDDNLYVYENSAVTRGLNLKGIEWAFTHVVGSNWHPLTMMSHMLDCRLYGLNAGGHHLTNVLLHTASVILLFLVLRQMTGRLWRSALVAAVFAIHPLRVESVVWVAERKDVLSGLFFMLTLWAYVRYVRRPFSPGRYLSVVFLFALGLLSKPMVVTLPFVLLLLDYWPLHRFTPPTPAPAVTGNGGSLKNHSIPWRLILEKIPLLALSGAVCVATMVAQKESIAPVPPVLRIGNAVVSYVVYLRQMFCPAGLAVYYPYLRNSLSWREITLAVVLLAAISAGVFLRRQRQPYLLIGWLWYLGMLIPVIGLVQVGLHARADRYTYLPQIGLYLALTWAVGSLCAGWRHRRLVLGVVAAVVITALSVGSFIQTSYWRNSESLWTHTLACTSDNAMPHIDLGVVCFKKGQMDEAIFHFQKGVEIDPENAKAHYNLGNALIQKGRVDEAIIHFQKAVAVRPEYAKAHDNLGYALLQKGRVDEAIIHFQKAVEIRSHSDHPDAGYNLARVAWLLATSPEASVRNGTRAVALAGQVEQLSGGRDPVITMTLAAAYAEAGRFPEAVATAERAQQLAVAQNNTALVNTLRGQIGLYQAGSPFRDAGRTNTPAYPGSP
jgi:tetratricopeptide (TPR) repeat protein